MNISKKSIKKIIKEELCAKLSDIMNIAFALTGSEKNEIYFKSKGFQFESSQKYEILRNNTFPIRLYISAKLESKIEEIEKIHTDFDQIPNDRGNLLRDVINLCFEESFSNHIKILDLEYQLEALADQADLISDLFSKKTQSLEPSEIARIMVEKIKKVINVEKSLICISEDGKSFIFPTHLDFDSKQIVYLLTSMTGNLLLKEFYNLPHEMIFNADTNFSEYRKMLPNLFNFLGRPSQNDVLHLPLYISPLFEQGKRMGFMLLVKNKESDCFKEEEMNYISILHYQVSLLMQMHNMINNILAVEQTKKDLQFAAEMQQNFFPEKIPHVEGLELYGECKLADKVGGDYYDYWVHNDKLFLIIADVSGHSLAAAILMSSFHALVETLLKDNGSPNKTFKAINEFLLHDVKDSGMFCTAFIGIYDLKTHEFLYANAAHPPPILSHKNSDSVLYLDSEGMILGVMAGVEFEEKRIIINKGDILMMFTDGLVEVFNKNMDMFEMSGLVKSFLANKSENLKTAALNIFKDINIFAEGARINDDMTIILSRF